MTAPALAWIPPSVFPRPRRYDPNDKPHGEAVACACDFCGRRSATWGGVLPRRWKRNKRGKLCCFECC